MTAVEAVTCDADSQLIIFSGDFSCSVYDCVSLVSLFMRLQMPGVYIFVHFHRQLSLLVDKVKFHFVIIRYIALASNCIFECIYTQNMEQILGLCT